MTKQVQKVAIVHTLALCATCGRIPRKTQRVYGDVESWTHPIVDRVLGLSLGKELCIDTRSRGLTVIDVAFSL